MTYNHRLATMDESIRGHILRNGTKYQGITFTKRDGTERKMCVHGVLDTTNAESFVVYDRNNGPRRIAPSRVKSIQCGGIKICYRYR